MKIRTAENLTDYLDKETSWRKRELSIILSEINKSSHSPYKLEALLRSAIPILYAHWEGYIKNSSLAYLNFIANQKLEYRKLAINLRALGIKRELFEMFYSDTEKMSKLLEIIETLLNKQDEKCSFNPEKMIDTKSNLNSKVFKEIIISLGLDYQGYKTKENIIDQKLLYYRNNIAHGKELFLGLPEYQNIYQEILTLIDTFKTDLENSAIQKKYLI